MQTHRLALLDVNRCVDCQLCMYACTRRFGDAGNGKSAILVKSVGGFERGFTVVVCRACEDPPCARACPEGALIVRPGGGVLLRSSLCIGCGLCREACIIGAVFWDEENNKPIICTQCGYCVDYCPHGVLGVEEIG